MVYYNEFLSLLFSIYKETGLITINIDDITEIINVLYHSDEFLEYRNKLKLGNIDIEAIATHPFCESINEDGDIEYSVNDKLQKKILERKKKDTMHLRNAINKYLLGRIYGQVSNGIIELQYEDPDGEYILPFIDNPMNEFETTLYTDGNITEDKFVIDPEYSKVRTVKVSNSTYTIMVNNQKKQPTNLKIRGLTVGDFIMIFNEASLILKKKMVNYEIVSKDKPRTYKLRRN